MRKKERANTKYAKEKHQIKNTKIGTQRILLKLELKNMKERDQWQNIIIKGIANKKNIF